MPNSFAVISGADPWRNQMDGQGNALVKGVDWAAEMKKQNPNWTPAGGPEQAPSYAIGRPDYSAAISSIEGTPENPAGSIQPGTSGTSSSNFNLSKLSGAPNWGTTNTAGPSSWDVAPNQTVASQLEQLVKSDSPLMQQARTRAMQAAEARGLSNSSLAATAGESAVLDAAMPIASADASTYGRAGEFNANSQNTFNLADNAFARDKTMADYNLAANEWAANNSFTRSEKAADAALARQGQFADTSLGREKDLASYNAGINTTATATADAAALQKGYINALNAARTDYAEKLAGISSSSTMDAGLKAETIRNLQTTYNTVIENYAKLLNWDPQSWLIGIDNAPSVSGRD